MFVFLFPALLFFYTQELEIYQIKQRHIQVSNNPTASMKEIVMARYLSLKSALSVFRSFPSRFSYSENPSISEKIDDIHEIYDY